MKCKYFALLMLLSLFVGCATIKVELQDQTGRAIPNPHYVLYGIEQPIQVLFFYTAYEEISDVDGTIIGKPMFLDLLKYNDIDAEKYKRITLTIQVNNPKDIEYSLYQQITLRTRDSNQEMKVGGAVNRSKLPQRQFVYNLPYGKEIRNVDHLVSLRVDNYEVMRIGNFRYSLIY